jgi:hypothetical protein
VKTGRHDTNGQAWPKFHSSSVDVRLSLHGGSGTQDNKGHPRERYEAVANASEPSHARLRSAYTTKSAGPETAVTTSRVRAGDAAPYPPLNEAVAAHAKLWKSKLKWGYSAPA